MEIQPYDPVLDYVDLIGALRDRGDRVTCRGRATRELRGVTLVLEDALLPALPLGVGRAVNLRFAAAEALSLVGGVARSDLLERAAPGYDRVLADARDRDYGAYGPRVGTQVRDAVALLRRDLTSRQAVVTVWEARDLTHVGDKPCTLTLQLLVRDGSLELHTAMRSQDVWLGVPYDLFMFTQLQHTVARELRVPAGRCVHRVTSLHLYDDDLPRVETLHAFDRDDARARRHLDQLPLGVVTATPADVNDPPTGFDVATYLLDDVYLHPRVDPLVSTEAERSANAWYVEQLGRLR